MRKKVLSDVVGDVMGDVLMMLIGCMGRLDHEIRDEVTNCWRIKTLKGGKIAGVLNKGHNANALTRLRELVGILEITLSRQYLPKKPSPSTRDQYLQ